MIYKYKKDTLQFIPFRNKLVLYIFFFAVSAASGERLK